MSAITSARLVVSGDADEAERCRHLQVVQAADQALRSPAASWTASISASIGSSGLRAGRVDRTVVHAGRVVVADLLLDAARGQSFFAEISSRMTFSWSFASSPAAQRRLQRTIEGGIGFFSRQAPFAKVRKSVHASALRSMSST